MILLEISRNRAVEKLKLDWIMVDFLRDKSNTATTKIKFIQGQGNKLVNIMKISFKKKILGNRTMSL